MNCALYLLQLPHGGHVVLEPLQGPKGGDAQLGVLDAHLHAVPFPGVLHL